MSSTSTIQVTELSGTAFCVSAHQRAIDIIPRAKLSPRRRSAAAVKAAYVRAAQALAATDTPDGAIALVATAHALLCLSESPDDAMCRA
jgi:hypothetical protein